MKPVVEPAYRRSEKALSAEVGDDIVALHIANGACYGMDKVAATVWKLLAEPQTEQGLCRELLKSYDVDEERCRSDVAALLGNLTREGLIEVTPD